MTRSEFPLPQEILDLIVSYLPHDSLRRILQVCRSFAPVARKYLYREITLLDDKNDPERDRHNSIGKLQRYPIFTEASFLALLRWLPSLNRLVKAIRICGSTRCTKQTLYTTSKHLHRILPLLPSLESISFQRTRPGPRIDGFVRVRYEPYMLMTAQIAKAIPPGVQAVWLDQVKFENKAVVDVFFRNCRHLAHLGLNEVSVLPEQHSGRIVSAVKSAWRRVFPKLPSILEPIELRSYAHGRLVSLPRLPFINKAPYFNVSSVTNLKLYAPGHHCCAMLPAYWDTLIRRTASSVQDLMIAVVLCETIYLPNPLWTLAGHKHLLSLFIVLWDITTLPENLFPHSLESLTVLVCKRYLAWSELDAQLNKFPFISRVEIFLLESYPPLSGLVDFCSLTWDSGVTGEWKEEVICGMPLLSTRGVLTVKQFRTVPGS